MCTCVQVGESARTLVNAITATLNWTPGPGCISPKASTEMFTTNSICAQQGSRPIEVESKSFQDKSRIAFAELLCEVLRRAKDIQEKPYCGGVVSSSLLKPRKSPNLAKFRQSVFLSRASHTYKRH